MIKELQWDRAFFKRKIGKLVISSGKALKLSGVLERARNAGFQYLTVKTKSFDTPVIQALETEGFYLTDIGMTFIVNPDDLLKTFPSETTKWIRSVRVPAQKDILILRTLIKGLFPQSRFYHDPFYSKKEADRLYQQWIENSVKGMAADIVFYINKTGFITCRKKGKNAGEIVLIGVRQRMRGKGFGTALVKQAMQWFRTQNVKTVTVRTQLRNPDAMNFYIRLGFMVKGYDLMFGKRL